MASHRHFPKMGGIHFPYWLPGRDPVQLEIIRFKAGFFLLFCCDESDAFLINCTKLLRNGLHTLSYYVIAFSKHKNRTMYFDFGHKH